MTDKPYPELQDKVIIAEAISFENYVVQFEGQHTEWHAGKVVQQVSNNTHHQVILLFLSTFFTLYLSAKKSGKLYLAGLPMYISDDVPAREPDLIVVLNDNLERVKSNHLEGPADIAVEVVSPGSERADRADKLLEYEQAGVTEYWLIDPLRKDATIFVLNDEGNYEKQRETANQRLQSTVLEGLLLSPNLLWQDELPEGMEILPLVQELIDPSR